MTLYYYQTAIPSSIEYLELEHLVEYNKRSDSVSAFLKIHFKLKIPIYYSKSWEIVNCKVYSHLPFSQNCPMAREQRKLSRWYKLSLSMLFALVFKN